MADEHNRLSVDSRQDSLDITGNMTEGGHDGVNWGGSDPTQLVQAFSLGSIDASNANVFYLIHRLCTLAATAVLAASLAGETQGAQSTGDRLLAPASSCVGALKTTSGRGAGAIRTVSVSTAGASVGGFPS